MRLMRYPNWHLTLQIASFLLVVRMNTPHWTKQKLQTSLAYLNIPNHLLTALFGELVSILGIGSAVSFFHGNR
jgi:hypothetical protein